MPILILALIALAVFIVMGIMLFGAITAERRERQGRLASGSKLTAGEASKSDAAHA